jgi:hypothetical protein
MERLQQVAGKRRQHDPRRRRPCPPAQIVFKEPPVWITVNNRDPNIFK